MSTDTRTDLPMTFDDSGLEAIVSMWWTGGMLKRAFRRVFRGSEVSSEAQFNMLRALERADGPLTQRVLGEQLLVDKANVSGLVDRLSNAGLVKRHPVPGDRRSIHVRLTPDGARVAAKMGAEYEKDVKAVMSALTEREHRTLTKLTRKVRIGLVKWEAERP
jgi:DNA-binding MarR family transcriptional regulator